MGQKGVRRRVRDVSEWVLLVGSTRGLQMRSSTSPAATESGRNAMSSPAAQCPFWREGKVVPADFAPECTLAIV